MKTKNEILEQIEKRKQLYEEAFKKWNVSKDNAERSTLFEKMQYQKTIVSTLSVVIEMPLEERKDFNNVIFS